MAAAADRFGIGWRPELAAGILGALDRIDVVEVIADDLFDAPARQQRAIRTLAAQVPVMLHGVSLGLCSAASVDPRRLERMARTVGAIEPEAWSEHLAFVRGGGLEIGHLAAPPRCEATVAGAIANLARARRAVGSAPLVENVASLIDPPGSALDEPSFIAAIVDAADAPLLLDLNNLHANAVNGGHNPHAALRALPLERVAAVHLAGGRWIEARNGERRLLDDHRHDVPDAVYALLEELGARAPRPLTVVLERDGAYPAFAALLAQLERARDALGRGRLRARAREVARRPPAPAAGDPYRAQCLEAFLARLYVDRDARRAFLADPLAAAGRAGLAPDACRALAEIDRVGLELAAHGFERKRAAR